MLLFGYQLVALTPFVDDMFENASDVCEFEVRHEHNSVLNGDITLHSSEHVFVCTLEMMCMGLPGSPLQHEHLQRHWTQPVRSERITKGDITSTIWIRIAKPCDLL